MNNTYLSSKPRFEILDGLRGVAALIVVAYHMFETYSGGRATQLINHGYLAVDFFFVLSGFVIGYAYDDRWDKMSLGNFFKRRLIRLHPMVIFGTLFGACLFYLGDCSAFPMISKIPWWLLVAVMLVGFTMLPVPPSLDIRGWAETNPLNGPSWSLMWEYLANILYALVIRRFSKTLLGIFVVFAGFLTCALAMNWDFLGLQMMRGDNIYTVIGGWSITPTEIYVGLSRLLYPFFAGLLLSRMGHLVKVKGGFWWCSLIIVVILVMPRMGDAGHAWVNGLYESVCIILLFPLIVAMGAGSPITGKHSVALCKWLGFISYPLYITHYPLVYLQISWASHHPNAPISMAVMMSAGLYICSIGVAYASLKLYDMPVREWLKEKLLHKKPTHSC